MIPEHIIGVFFGALFLFGVLYIGELFYEDDECEDEDDECDHLKTFKKVITINATCETTVIVCLSCRKELTKPETDCA